MIFQNLQNSRKLLKYAITPDKHDPKLGTSALKVQLQVEYKYIQKYLKLTSTSTTTTSSFKVIE